MHSSSILSFALASLAPLARAATVTYNWDISWVTASPDGFARPVMGVNGQWPNPKIEATVGDTVVVNVNNKLVNETLSLHFHGINQVGTNYMDGPAGFNQCPVPPGSSMTYQFIVDAPGTYWWHSHMGQIPDGLRGPMIVHDPNDPWKSQYDEEVILTLSDWYHTGTIDLVRQMLVPTNTQFLPPFPDSIVVNEGASPNINFVKGKTYRVRIISFSSFASTLVHFDSHTMQIIATDGSYVQKEQAYQIRVGPAQRYDILISAIDRDNVANYPFLLSLDINRDFTNTKLPDPVVWPHNVTGYLVMNPALGFNRTDVVPVWKPKDDSKLTPLDKVAIYGGAAGATNTMRLDFSFCFDKNGIPRACFNGKTNVPQKVPTLYSVATTGTSNTNPLIYGNINPFVVPSGAFLDIILNNNDDAVHPWHLHGHQFQVLKRAGTGAGNWPGRASNYQDPPMRRDVVFVNGQSHAVLRIKIDNPGVHLFHCHIEWHVEMGLTATLIAAPEKLAGLTFPADALNNCKIQGIPTAGNAGGNTVNYTDTTNFNVDPDVTYNGALYTPVAQRSRVMRRL